MPQRLALLVGANPRVLQKGPNVRLYEGNWKISCVGVVNSVLFLHGCAVPFQIPADVSFESNGMNVYVEMDKIGTEPFISVFAELVE